MHHFSAVAMKTLQRYKALLKKQCSSIEYRKKLQELQLDRSLPREDTELYNLLNHVVQTLEADGLGESEVTANGLRFSGGSQSIQDMRDLLASYHVDTGRVVHTSQMAARAMVHAIQLMVLPAMKHDETVADQLDEYSLKIARYGVKEQHLSFWNSLKTQVGKHSGFFTPLLDRYQRYLEQYVAD